MGNVLAFFAGSAPSPTQIDPNPHRRTLPPIPPVPAELVGEMGHRTALYLIIGLSLSRTVGGEFWLPETGSPVADGNYFARLGSWESRGCGSPATQRRIRQRLIDLGLLHVRRAGLPARLYYRFDAVKCERFLTSLGCGTAASQMSAPQPTVPDSAPRPSQPEPSLPPNVADYINAQCAAPGTRNPAALRTHLVRLFHAGELDMSAARKSRPGPGARDPRTSSARHDISIEEISRLAHPGESWEAAAARIARQNQRNSSRD